MTGRHHAAARSGGSFYEQQHQQLLQSHQSQHPTMPSTTPAVSSNLTMQLHAAALQQRLHHQQRSTLPGAYEGCYYPSGSTSYIHRSSGYSYVTPHYGGGSYLSHPHHPHHLGQATTYSHHPHDAYGLLAQRSRFLPYPQQQSPHLHHSMFTPAGQQLMPSSVLHYPPRSSSIYHPHSSEEPMHPQQPPPHPSHMYDFRSEPHAQYHLQPRHPYMPMHHVTTAAATAGAYNPYAISQHHYQQSQTLLQRSPTATQAPAISSEAMSASLDLTPLAHSNKMSNTLSEIPLSETSNSREVVCKKELNDDNEDERLREKVSSTAQQQRSGTDCGPTTTSPPLISGADSGISCCSTRGGAHSDSTQSTPVYCNDYQPPMSVGSSSSSLLHCADVKEYEEPIVSSTEKVKDDVASDMAFTKEAAGKILYSDKIDDSDKNAATVKLEQTKEAKHDGKKNESNETFSNENDAQELQAMTRLSSQSSSISTSATTTISSPKKERCTTPFRHVPSPHAFQQQQQQKKQPSATKPQQHFQNHINNSWSPFSISPNSWTQAYSNVRYTSPSNNHEQQQSPPLIVPVPPHNSPVDYSPLATPSLYQPTAGTKKNRIIECDLIPSKKSKRRCSTEAQVPVREEILNITPLPGFLQAFGSTEIGRFSETFLHSPPVIAAEQSDSFSSGAHAEPRMLPRSWSSYPFESFDFSSSRGRSRIGRDAAQFNLQQYGSRPPFGERSAELMAYERHGYGGRMNGSHTEIRCNGY